MNYKYLYYPTKRPNNTKIFFKTELINYIKEEVKTGHFPSRRELESQFHFKLDGLFLGIRDLYSAAGLEYKLKINQEIKYKKAKIYIKNYSG